MAFTQDLKTRLVTSLAEPAAAEELEAAVTAANKTAANVTDSAIVAVTGVDGTGSNAAALTGTNTALTACKRK